MRFRGRHVIPLAFYAQPMAYVMYIAIRSSGYSCLFWDDTSRYFCVGLHINVRYTSSYTRCETSASDHRLQCVHMICGPSENQFTFQDSETCGRFSSDIFDTAHSSLVSTSSLFPTMSPVLSIGMTRLYSIVHIDDVKHISDVIPIPINDVTLRFRFHSVKRWRFFQTHFEKWKCMDKGQKILCIQLN